MRIVEKQLHGETPYKFERGNDRDNNLLEECKKLKS